MLVEFEHYALMVKITDGILARYIGIGVVNGFNFPDHDFFRRTSHCDYRADHWLVFYDVEFGRDVFTLAHRTVFRVDRATCHDSDYQQ